MFKNQITEGFINKIVSFILENKKANISVCARCVNISDKETYATIKKYIDIHSANIFALGEYEAIKKDVSSVFESFNLNLNDNYEIDSVFVSLEEKDSEGNPKYSRKIFYKRGSFKMIKRIGESDYFFGVWYKITNKDSLYKEGISKINNTYELDKNEEPKSYDIGFYSREPLNSFKLIFDVIKLNRFDEVRYEVSAGFFADTRDCGIDSLVEIQTDDYKNINPKFFDFIVKVLEHSGAEVDVEKCNERIRNVQNEIDDSNLFVEEMQNIVKSSIEKKIKELQEQEILEQNKCSGKKEETNG